MASQSHTFLVTKQMFALNQMEKLKNYVSSFIDMFFAGQGKFRKRSSTKTFKQYGNV